MIVIDTDPAIVLYSAQAVVVAANGAFYDCMLCAFNVVFDNTLELLELFTYLYFIVTLYSGITSNEKMYF